MSNKALFAAVFVVLVGILSVILIERSTHTNPFDAFSTTTNGVVHSNIDAEANDGTTPAN